MSEQQESAQRHDDRFVFDAALAELLLGWQWYRDPQWDWVGMWPPDDPQWVRYNFPDQAERVDGPGDHKLMPAWNVGGFHSSDGPNRMGIPRFSSDWRAMATCIEQMRLRGFWWKGSNFAAPDRPAHATFSSQTNSWSGQAETTPKATAMAALSALTEMGVPGEVSSQTVKGRLTSIRNAAQGNSDPTYRKWLLDRSTGDTVAAALEFIAEWATAALRSFGE
ncbi:MAG: hypothetical protein IPJ94_00085 [Chloroflexi bacterium]|nr:hypothetical protein [Chloroflexota bacterium]